MQVAWRHEHRRGTGDPQQKSDQVEQQAPGLGRSARAVASVLIVVLAAVAFATLLRPRNGYASTDRLLVVLVLGAASAVGALIIAGAAATLRRRSPDRSLWRAVTSLRSMSFVLALFIAAAVASQVLHAIRPASGTAGASAAARGDFRRWQATAVPIMVQWMAAIRNDNAFVRGLPDTAAGRLRQRVDRSARTLARLSRSLAAAAPRLPQRPNLRRLTQELEQALAAARRAQASYMFALAVANRAGGIRTAQQALVRRLIARGNKGIRRSLATMTGVSLDANKLGASLFVEAP